MIESHVNFSHALYMFQVEVISSQYKLSDFLDRITNTLKKLKCEVMVGAKHFELKNYPGDILGRVSLCLFNSEMMAAIDIRTR